MITEQTPAEWLESEFEYVWSRWGITFLGEPDTNDLPYVIFRVPGMRDHSGRMISLKEDEYLSHIGGRVTQSGELYDLSNDLEVITL